MSPPFASAVLLLYRGVISLNHHARILHGDPTSRLLVNKEVPQWLGVTVSRHLVPRLVVESTLQSYARQVITAPLDQTRSYLNVPLWALARHYSLIAILVVLTLWVPMPPTSLLIWVTGRIVLDLSLSVHRPIIVLFNLVRYRVITSSTVQLGHTNRSETCEKKYRFFPHHTIVAQTNISFIHSDAINRRYA
jgi:hypothetical protein